MSSFGLDFDQFIGYYFCPSSKNGQNMVKKRYICLLYTSDAADDMQCVDLGGRRIIKKKWIFGQNIAFLTIFWPFFEDGQK